MITMDDYLELLPSHQAIINYLMELAKEEAVNEEFFNKKMKKALKKDITTRTNEACSIINKHFSLEKKGNCAIKLSDVKYNKNPKHINKAMVKLQQLQSKVDGYIAFKEKPQPEEENTTTGQQQSNIDIVIQPETVNPEVQALQDDTPGKEPNAIEGQMDITELEGGNNEKEEN